MVARGGRRFDGMGRSRRLVVCYLHHHPELAQDRSLGRWLRVIRAIQAELGHA